MSVPTDDQINAAIAKVLEFKYWKPNYVADLNLMAQVRATLNYEQRVLFVCALIDVQQPGFCAQIDTTVGKLGCFGLIDASARQQAEAFLKTVGKWPKEDRDP